MGQRENRRDIGDICDIGDRKFLSGRKRFPQEGLKESIDLNSVGMFEPHRIDEPLLDIPLNGASGNMQQLCRFLDSQASG